MAPEMIPKLKAGLAALDPVKHSFLEGQRPFCAPGKSAKLISSSGSRSSSLPEMVILVGLPGSGKSTYTKQNFPNHERVNQDTLLTKERCYAAALQALQEGKSIVVDNTNPTMQARKPFIDIAKKLNAPVRAITLVVDQQVAFERNVKRFTEGKAPMVPKMVYHIFKKSFQPPSLAEGFCLVETFNNE